MSLHPEDGNSSIIDLPLQDPQCNNDSCLAFLAAHTLSQAEISYTRRFEYGQWVTWYYLIIIFLAMIVYLFRLRTDRRPTLASERLHVSLLDRFIALGRFVFYRHKSGLVRYRTYIRHACFPSLDYFPPPALDLCHPHLSPTTSRLWLASSGHPDRAHGRRFNAPDYTVGRKGKHPDSCDRDQL